MRESRDELFIAVKDMSAILDYIEFEFQQRNNVKLAKVATNQRISRDARISSASFYLKPITS